MGVNVVVCRIMFGLKLERIYTVLTISSYIVANVLRCVVGYATSDFALAIAAGAVIEGICVAALTIIALRHLQNRNALPSVSVAG